jgi:hypothetical protein
MSKFSRKWPTLKDKIGRTFQLLDLHDDNLLSVTVFPPRTKVNAGEVVLELEDDVSQNAKSVRFIGCGNLRVNMDFDVLANNYFAQTDVTTCEISASRMKQFVRAQAPHWHVKYMPLSRKYLPIRKKLAQIKGYRLFKVTFFGGTVEVLAKAFSVETAANKPKSPA